MQGKMGRNMGVEGVIPEKGRQKEANKVAEDKTENDSVKNFKWTELSFSFSSICENPAQRMSETSWVEKFSYLTLIFPRPEP